MGGYWDENGMWRDEDTGYGFYPQYPFNPYYPVIIPPGATIINNDYRIDAILKALEDIKKMLETITAMVKV